MEDRFLIVGLGNPGQTYDDTRHNVGFRIVKALAQKHQISFRPSLIRMKGSVAEGTIKEKPTTLLLPLTFMNESGLAVRKGVDFYKLPLDRLIVVADDVDLPFGGMRLKTKGSSGGHKGLKSIEAHLGTQDYTRLKVGVGGREKGDLADYVLDKFTKEEQSALPEIIDRAVMVLELWVAEGAPAAMHEANK
ncbi:MAG: aminoacyl-tRNA hydrolase [Verrucomicrobia bacterium]|nr:aminoacyl-tRNA hydrolase [Verrucomicrobiota bacterium]